MASIRESVGQGGVNLPADVRKVQRLLNEHGLPPLRSLDTDGIAGQATITAIRHFQSVRVGMKNPDGRVDPSGRTWRKLRDVRPNNAPPESKPRVETPATRQADRKARRGFVRPQVKERPITTKIIDAILPHFQGVRAVVISGYLSDADLFWKVNYHWEYLLWMVDHALTLGVSDQYKTGLKNIRSALLSCKPDPDVGYRESPTLGKPEDRSSLERFDLRHKVLRQKKRWFKKIVEAADLKRKSIRGPRAFDLAAAPVAHPGTSKHSTGYALDIQGDNPRIKAISKKLGATLIFDEKSHVHVEFKNGVPRRR
jgi:hypothetical protein